MRFFTAIRPYPELAEQRKSMLDSMLDLLKSSEAVLEELSIPFGCKRCQLVPEEFLPEVQNAQGLKINSIQIRFDLKALVANITVNVDWLRGTLRTKAIESTCDDYDFHAAS